MTLVMGWQHLGPLTQPAMPPTLQIYDRCKYHQCLIDIPVLNILFAFSINMRREIGTLRDGNMVYPSTKTLEMVPQCGTSSNVGYTPPPQSNNGVIIYVI